MSLRTAEPITGGNHKSRATGFGLGFAALAALALVTKDLVVTGPAYDPANAEHARIAQAFTSSCAPEDISHASIVDAFKRHTQTGGSDVSITVPTAAFDACIVRRTEEALREATFAYQVRKDASLVFGFAAAGLFMFGLRSRQTNETSPRAAQTRPLRM